MNIMSYVILAVLTASVALAFHSIAKGKGGCGGCTGNCSECMKALKELSK